MNAARIKGWQWMQGLAGAILLSTGSAAERLEREPLLMFREGQRIAPVTTTAEWQKRRAEIVAGMEKIMGPLPVEKRVPLEVRQESEVDAGDFLRREISYAVEPGARVTVYLLLPKAALQAGARLPAALALMPTNGTEGNKPVVGLGLPGSKPGRNYGEELARRGWVVVAPPYPHLGDYKPDLRGLGYASGTMKAIWDNVRALDVLDVTPGVARGGYGAIGHSLGGHNAIYTGVFDPRIKAVVSSCGFDSYLDYYSERPQMWRAGQGWTQERYMPRLAEYAERKAEIPFDFHELVGALAPRAFLAIAPLGDTNFKWQSVARIVRAAQPVFALHGVAEKLEVVHPDCAHDFPPEMREKAYRWLETHVGR